MQSIQLIECPRDAMQGIIRHIPTKVKIAYINSLLKIGFHTIDFGSFVSPKAIPQMADTPQVLEGLNIEYSTSKLLAIVANTRGAREALTYPSIDYLGFPFSVSPTFQQRNANSTPAQSLITVAEINELCQMHGKKMVVYLSMAFGNPYGDEYNKEILLQYAEAMVARSIFIISLADTVGVATPNQISSACNALIPAYPSIVFGVHLHSNASGLQEKVQAALTSGCTRFDGALTGAGGCPMAQDSLVGNLPTEFLINYLQNNANLNHIDHTALAESLQLAGEIFD